MGGRSTCQPGSWSLSALPCPAYPCKQPLPQLSPPSAPHPPEGLGAGRVWPWLVHSEGGPQAGHPPLLPGQRPGLLLREAVPEGPREGGGPSPEAP